MASSLKNMDEFWYKRYKKSSWPSLQKLLHGLNLRF